MLLVKKLLLLCLILLSGLLHSQDIGIGEWREHLPYSRVSSLAAVGDRIYCATPYSLFYLDKSDNSVQRISKVNGLSDIGISRINYNEAFQTLVIAYTNTNLDLIKGNQIINISDIKRKPILGNKTINHITFRDNYAYLSCGFGIVILDIEKEEIADTYYIGSGGTQINVFDITFTDGDTIFAACENGIYKASLQSPNLADFSSWIKDDLIPHPQLKYNFIEFFSGRVYTNNSNQAYGSDTIFVYENGGWEKFNPNNTSTRHNIRSMDNKLIIVNDGSVEVFDETLTRIYNTYAPNDSYLAPLDGMIDVSSGDVWVGDRNAGLVRTFNNGWSAEYIQPNGPKTVNVFDMSAAGKDLWIVPGGRETSWGNLYRRGETYFFINGTWAYLDYKNTPELDPVRDFVCVIIDPENKDHVFAGSWGWGLYEFTNGQFTMHYDDENSTLQKFTGAEQINIGGLAYDDDHNLWVANSNAGSVLSVKTNSGEWHAFSLGAIATGIDVGKILIDYGGQKWMLVRDHGLLVFNDNHTITNPADDKVRKLSASAGNGNLPGLKIMSFAVDMDGELWIGTDEGVAVIYSPENVFTGGNYDAQRILVEQDGYVQYLLESEAVTAITVDGGNNKWFGTDRAGVFLMSPDGTEELLHFTEDNSPLLSNSISSIAINDDGEVFIGTSKGLISYRYSSTPPNPTNDDVYAFPNPVRQDYNGVIAIKGLVQNADVKITDITGTLIFATRAEGGQAIWNGRNFDGKKANTGVYLVFISNEDGSKTEVTKILVIN